MNIDEAIAFLKSKGYRVDEKTGRIEGHGSRATNLTDAEIIELAGCIHY